MKNRVIVVLEADSVGTDVSWDILKKFGELRTYEHTPHEKIAERIHDAEIVVPNKCLLNEETLRDAKNVKIICEAATGYNNIDVDYCKKRGITVNNAVGYSTESVVQHTFAMLFNIMEHIPYYSDYVTDGDYSRQESFTHMGMPFHELYGMRFGIIGLGAIGRRVADVASAFGAEVVYYSASGNTYGVEYKSLDFDTFLESSDIVSCHAPLNEYTRGLMNYDAFSKMKKSAYFLNLGRGPIVVEKDLVRAINEDLLAGAALDVFEQEPLPADSPLLGINEKNRIIMTPHIAWATVEARTRLVEDVARRIQTYVSQ